MPTQHRRSSAEYITKFYLVQLSPIMWLSERAQDIHREDCQGRRSVVRACVRQIGPRNGNACQASCRRTTFPLASNSAFNPAKPTFFNEFQYRWVNDRRSRLLERGSFNRPSGSLDTDDEDVDLENLEEVEADLGEQRNLAKLRDRFLDRLAEVLARFKTEPNTRRSSGQDAKHVCATMMVMCEDETSVRILCAKNEGLDKVDDEFLGHWKNCLENVAKAGRASEADRNHLLDLILTHQRPRVEFYIHRLQLAYRKSSATTGKLLDSETTLSKAWVEKQPILRLREWEDDNGLRYKIPTTLPQKNYAGSDVAQSGLTFQENALALAALSTDIEELCNRPPAGNVESSLLKRLLISTFNVWMGVKTRSAFRACLIQLFLNEQARKTAEKALLFLCRIYYGTTIFINTAEQISAFKSIICVLVPSQSFNRCPIPQLQSEALVSAERLGIIARHKRIRDRLGSSQLKNAFRVSRREKRYIHCEVQLLHYYDESFKSSNQKYQTHPYIGCSRLCCYLCYCFTLVYGGFDVRGTHETIMNRWEIPLHSPTGRYSSTVDLATQRLLQILKAELQSNLYSTAPPRNYELRAQSSIGLSTAKTMLEEEIVEMERSELAIRSSMMMPMISSDAISVFPLPERPGFAVVFGGEIRGCTKPMRLGEAETLLINHLRHKYGFEPLNELPPRKSRDMAICKRCGSISNLRCRSCRMSYCSQTCQKKDWKRHVFLCTGSSRPNEVDRLKLYVSHWFRAKKIRKESLDDAYTTTFLRALYSDDKLSTTFGFDSCEISLEVSYLLCIYRELIRSCGSVVLQSVVNDGNLWNFMETYSRCFMSVNASPTNGCQCFAWFLQMRERDAGFPVEHEDGFHFYLARSMAVVSQIFSLDSRVGFLASLSPTEIKVLWLYAILCRDFNCLPDVDSSQWLDFGFCFCKNLSDRQRLRKALLELPIGGSSLGEIAHAWKNDSLLTLMKARGIDVYELELNDIVPQRPRLEEFGIYRLIAEVSHALSGRFCLCFRPKEFNSDSSCHSKAHLKHETHLSRETDGDYGFHGVNAWERWQLFSFYAKIFNHPHFDARAMQRARHDPDPGALDSYLERLIPDFRRKMRNWSQCDVMFPKLKARVQFLPGRPPCYCIVHDTTNPDGLDSRMYVPRNWAVNHPRYPSNTEDR
ncbi:uncharacterized protein BDR25DRAFT_366441 [Lindgomyces ingoldianus]|uniref:Uncharacterized protein n=1 Tax=Lindgomyces ingoldianus TaxID=673940 RepID=A0ACB6QZS9_9PLEO|nr:uncharacterized protein BDR25DRAFT_366441 [Lindgomyces ingoldianus]KAF2472426.1 hypothetical protein BDR25DRAFT_366441 [Lindgomyces ingoldianus]